METYFENLVQELRTRRDEVNDEIGELNEKVAAFKSELKRIDAILRLADPTETKPKKAASKAKTNGGIGSRSAPKVLEYMEQHKEVEDWTASQLSKAMGLHHSSINAAFNWLRENEKIRATRRVRGGGNAYAPWS